MVRDWCERERAQTQDDERKRRRYIFDLTKPECTSRSKNALQDTSHHLERNQSIEEQRRNDGWKVDFGGFWKKGNNRDNDAHPPQLKHPRAPDIFQRFKYLFFLTRSRMEKKNTRPEDKLEHVVCAARTKKARGKSNTTSASTLHRSTAEKRRKRRTTRPDCAPRSRPDHDQSHLQG